MITSVSAPTYADPHDNSIRCTIGMEGVVGTTTYLAVNGDKVSQSMYDDLVVGKYGTVSPYVPQDASALLPRQAADCRRAATAYASAVVAQIVPDTARAFALQCAASLVASNAGKAPTVGPSATAFAALAASYGSTVDGFVALVAAVQVASMTIAAATATFSSESAAAADSTALATSMARFQATMNQVVASVNSVLTFPISSPPPVSVPGVNA